MQRNRSNTIWLMPILLLTIMALVVWLSPEERTLGARIKIVYVHVAFVWAGLAGIALTGMLSAAVFIRKPPQWLGKLLPIMSVTSVSFFTIGFLLSLVAAEINWGGILWNEPRMIASMRILAMAVIVQVLVTWFSALRIRAALYIGFLAYTIFTNVTVNRAIHPVNPIFSSESNQFAITVLTLTGIVALLALWFMRVWSLRTRAHS